MPCWTQYIGNGCVIGCEMLRACVSRHNDTACVLLYTWSYVHSALDASLFVHEIGHNLGLGHSGTSGEYDDLSSVMGFGPAVCVL